MPDPDFYAIPLARWQAESLLIAATGRLTTDPDEPARRLARMAPELDAAIARSKPAGKR